MTNLLLVGIAALTLTADATACGTAPGSLVEVSDSLAIGVCADGVMRVVHTPSNSTTAKDALRARKSLMVDPSFPASVPSYTERTDASTMTIATSLMTAVVGPSGAVSFADAEGAPLVSEIASKFTPTTDPALTGTRTYVIEQSFTATEGEGLYGGGEFQNVRGQLENHPNPAALSLTQATGGARGRAVNTGLKAVDNHVKG